MGFISELKRRNVFRVGIAYTVAAWVLLQVVDLVLDNIAAPEWVMKVFMLAVGVGLPLALILAWAFEMTPEGLKRETAVDPGESITPQTGRKLDRIIIASLGVAVIFLVVDRLITPGTPGDGARTAIAESAQSNSSDGKPIHEILDKSIAVLPLANRSVREEDAFFAEGMHDELLTQLSRVSALRVISRTSVMGYAGTTKRMPDIGRELGVSTLLEGGVQRSGNRVRINVQLIEAATDEHLWAEVYDRELTADNLFEIQTDITKAIANALQAVLTGKEQQSISEKPTENLEAYAHYLRGKAAAATYGRSAEQIEASIASYQKAIELDPRFAAAYAALSTDWIERFWSGGRVGELGPARHALDMARELAPDSAETHVAEGYYYYWGNLEYQPAIDAFDLALAARPGDLLAMRGRAYALRRMGKFEDSLAGFRQILSIDPLNGAGAVEMAYTLHQTGRFDEAFAKIQQAKALGARHGFARFVEAIILASELRLDEALSALTPLSEAAPVELGAHLEFARYKRDDKMVDRVIETLQRRPSASGGVSDADQARLRILWDRGQDEELKRLTEELEPKLLELLKTSPDQAGPLLNLMIIYGARGDRSRLDEMASRFDNDLKPDALRLAETGSFIPGAYAMLGDAQAAMDRLEPVIEKYGIWRFYSYAEDPVFDAMRDNPRFKALDDRYRQWLETRQK